MPIFPDIQPILLLLEPPLATVPPLPALNYQVAAQENTHTPESRVSGV